MLNIPPHWCELTDVPQKSKSSKRKMSKQKKTISPFSPKRTCLRPEKVTVMSADMKDMTVIKRNTQIPIIGHDIHKSVQRCFVESIEKMMSDTGDTYIRKSKQQHPLYLRLLSLAEKETKTVTQKVQCIELECISKQYEDSYLREPREGESACSEGQECEAIQMAQVDIHTPSEKGFVCVAFCTPNKKQSKMCLLCLRKHISLWYYTNKARGDMHATIIQPHRNIIGQTGEYHPDACIYPSSRKFEGITDPFIRHERHHYRYDNDTTTIYQVGVDF